MSAPERIWLQDGGDFDAASEMTWCQHSIDEADTEYVRADLAASATQPDPRDEVIARLVEALERLNAACDAMWNDDRRTEKINGYFTGQQPWQIKEVHMRSISEAQQRLPSALAAAKTLTKETKE